MNNYNQKLFESMNNNASNLVSKNIDEYFNKLLNDINNDSIIVNKPTFYTTYIEHNILLIVILGCIAIFLFFRYYSKSCSKKNAIREDDKKNGKKNRKEDGKEDGKEDEDEDEEEDKIKKKKKKKIIKKHIDNELRSLYEERQLLENEKKSLLNIIDDLSNYNVKNDIQETFTNSTNATATSNTAATNGYSTTNNNGYNTGEKYEEYNNDNYNQFLDINSSNITKVNNINIENPYI